MSINTFAEFRISTNWGEQRRRTKNRFLAVLFPQCTTQSVQHWMCRYSVYTRVGFIHRTEAFRRLLVASWIVCFKLIASLREQSMTLRVQLITLNCNLVKRREETWKDRNTTRGIWLSTEMENWADSNEIGSSRLFLFLLLSVVSASPLCSLFSLCSRWIGQIFIVQCRLQMILWDPMLRLPNARLAGIACLQFNPARPGRRFDRFNELKHGTSTGAAKWRS